MKAYQLTAWQAPPEMREVPVPEPGPGQVLVKVGGAGACHSDLHLMEWPEGTMDFDLPFTLGHENAGWVEALGAGSKDRRKAKRSPSTAPGAAAAAAPAVARRRTTASGRPRSAPSAAGSGLTAAWPSTCSSPTRDCCCHWAISIPATPRRYPMPR